MKQIRLLALSVMLIASFFMYEQPASACAGGGEGCPPGAPRDNGCACCSDNHCVSGFCNSNDKCANKPGGEQPVDPPQV